MIHSSYCISILYSLPSRTNDFALYIGCLAAKSKNDIVLKEDNIKKGDYYGNLLYVLGLLIFNLVILIRRKTLII